MPDIATDEVKIADLGLDCSYDVRYHATRTNTECGRPATSLVLRSDAPHPRMNRGRCDEHRGKLTEGEEGEPVDSLPLELAQSLFGYERPKPDQPTRQVKSWLDVDPSEPY